MDKYEIAINDLLDDLPLFNLSLKCLRDLLR